MKPPDPTPGVMSGVSDLAIQAGSYAVTLTRLAPGLRLPRHAHENGTLNVVLDGHFGEAVGRCRMETHGPATAILKPAGAVHENVVGKSLVECLVVDFRGSDPPAVVMRRSAEVARVAGRLRVELARHPDVSSLVIEELVVLLVAESTASPSPVRCVGDRWLEQARELLHDEPGPQSLGELDAEWTGIRSTWRAPFVPGSAVRWVSMPDIFVWSERAGCCTTGGSPCSRRPTAPDTAIRAT
jgi:quercetin dioxygenase-like cupin family protein